MLRRMVGVIGLVVLLAACAPSEQEFMGSCYARCSHTMACGFGVPAGYSSCNSYCLSEWEFANDRAWDCVWFAEYWFDCQSHLACDDFYTDNCVTQLGDMAAACQ